MTSSAAVDAPSESQWPEGALYFLGPPHGLKRYDHETLRCRCEICRSARRTYDQERYQRKAEEIKARVRAYSKANRERIAAQKKAYYESGYGEVARARAKVFYQTTKDRQSVLQKAWRQTEAGRESHRLSNMKRRRAPGRVTPEQAMARVAYFGWRCAYCKGPFEHLDHVIALATGGSHWPANLRPSCEACNLSKGATPWRPWLLKMSGR